MKCQSCGADIPADSQSCPRCGDAKKAVANDKSKKVYYKEIPRRMSFEYAHVPIDSDAKILHGIIQMCESFTEQKINIDDFLSKVTDFIYRNLGIADVTIGLRNPKDGLYRYNASAGVRESTVAFKKTLAYKKEDFFGAPPYTRYQISKYTYLYLVEDTPYTEAEMEAYNWPSLITIKRTSLTQALEGDYLNIHLIGPGDDMFGWIDISGTKQRTFPDIKVIKWIELIGRIVTATILMQESGSNEMHESR